MNDHFYNQLTPRRLSLAEVLDRPGYFEDVPRDWSVIITDIRDSTGAFAAGQYHAVNIAAAAGIVLALNVARRHGVELPFVFGGDGASILTPPSLLPEIIAGLEVLRANTAAAFKLDLRVGAIGMNEILEAGHRLKVAKLHLGAGFDPAIFLDSGLYYAERVVKGNANYQEFHHLPAAVPDVHGLQCLWDDVKPPPERSEILVLIIEPWQAGTHETIYRAVLDKLDELYGSLEQRHPIHLRRLHYTLNPAKLSLESYICFGRFRWQYLLRRFLSALASQVRDSQSARHKFIIATDSLKVDGRLKTMVAGTPSQREKLLWWLDEKERAGQLVYGHFVAPSSTITCFVHPAREHYINFLDGTGGGYVRAATELKDKLKAWSTK